MGNPSGKNTTKGAEPSATDASRAGRVEVDARGRNVWRWAREGIDSTSVLLKGLENKDLALEPTQKVPVVPSANPPSRSSGGRPTHGPASQAKPDKKPALAGKQSAGKQAEKSARRPSRNAGGDRGGGFDPYNSR